MREVSVERLRCVASAAASPRGEGWTAQSARTTEELSLRSLDEIAPGPGARDTVISPAAFTGRTWNPLAREGEGRRATCTFSMHAAHLPRSVDRLAPRGRVFQHDTEGSDRDSPHQAATAPCRGVPRERRCGSSVRWRPLGDDGPVDDRARRRPDQPGARSRGLRPCGASPSRSPRTWVRVRHISATARRGERRPRSATHVARLVVEHCHRRVTSAYCLGAAPRLASARDAHLVCSGRSLGGHGDRGRHSGDGAWWRPHRSAASDLAAGYTDAACLCVLASPVVACGGRVREPFGKQTADESEASGTATPGLGPSHGRQDQPSASRQACGHPPVRLGACPGSGRLSRRALPRRPTSPPSHHERARVRAGTSVASPWSGREPCQRNVSVARLADPEEGRRASSRRAGEGHRALSKVNYGARPGCWPASRVLTLQSAPPGRFGHLLSNPARDRASAMAWPKTRHCSVSIFVSAR